MSDKIQLEENPDKFNLKSDVVLTIKDLVSNFVYYDRKGDEDLTCERLWDGLKNGTITVDEIADVFKKELSRKVEEL